MQEMTALPNEPQPLPKHNITFRHYLGRCILYVQKLQKQKQEKAKTKKFQSLGISATTHYIGQEGSGYTTTCHVNIWVGMHAVVHLYACSRPFMQVCIQSYIYIGMHLVVHLCRPAFSRTFMQVGIQSYIYVGLHAVVHLCRYACSRTLVNQVNVFHHGYLDGCADSQLYGNHKSIKKSSYYSNEVSSLQLMVNQLHFCKLYVNLNYSQ